MSGGSVLLSVVIPAYNRAGTITAAIQSALQQDYRPLEVIVVDDGSRDDTIDRLKEFEGAIRIIQHQSNMGASAARNTGIEAAKGEYVAFLDSDDHWKPYKTSRQMAFMKKCGFAMSCTGFSSIYEGGGPLLRKRRPYQTQLSIEDVVWGVYVAPGTTLIAKRSLLLAIGGYDTTLRRLEDWDLLLKALLHVGELGFLDEDLAVLHPSDGCSTDLLRASADVLLVRASQLLSPRYPGLLRKLRAGIAFEVATSYWKWGDRGRSILWLLKTIALAPFRNQSIRIILIPWVKDLLLKSRHPAKSGGVIRRRGR